MNHHHEHLSPAELACTDCERQLLELPGPPSGVLREHLLQCPDCRAFWTILQTVQTPLPEPTPELDARVRSLALLAMRRQRQWRALVRTAAAVVAVLAAVAWFVTPQGDRTPLLAAGEALPLPEQVVVDDWTARVLYAETALEEWSIDATQFYLTSVEPSQAASPAANLSPSTPVMPMDAEYSALSSDLDALELLVTLGGS